MNEIDHWLERLFWIAMVSFRFLRFGLAALRCNICKRHCNRLMPHCKKLKRLSCSKFCSTLRSKVFAMPDTLL